MLLYVNLDSSRAAIRLRMDSHSLLTGLANHLNTDADLKNKTGFQKF